MKDQTDADVPPPVNESTADDGTGGPGDPSGSSLTIFFTRSSSPSFLLVRRQLDLLSSLGSLTVGRDAQGRELSFELTLRQNLVPAAGRISHLLSLVQSWKTTEVSFAGDLLTRPQQSAFLQKLELVRRCWQRRKPQGPPACRQSCRLGCDALRLDPSLPALRSSRHEPPWFGVGTFDGHRVLLDKPQLHAQVADEHNAQIRLCPFFDASSVHAAIDGLPDTVSADDPDWTLVYDRAGQPAWLWPRDQEPPMGLSTDARGATPSGLQFRLDLPSDSDDSTDTGSSPARAVPLTRYADVVGQDLAVEAVRDTLELPLKHPDLFARLGAIPRGQGLLLAGPPGTGKTLLARAVAGECGAHIEIVNGPALLSKWLGETEAALRAVFDRAQKFAPAVILFDELDSLAPSRSGDVAHHYVALVAQLLVLLDGLESRGQVFVLGTTNRPDHLDPALRRPGRLDQVLWMGLPDERSRAALFHHYLRPLRLDAELTPDELVTHLAAVTPGLTGADIAGICQRAVLLCVKEASRAAPVPSDIALGRRHLLAALGAHEQGASPEGVIVAPVATAPARDPQLTAGAATTPRWKDLSLRLGTRSVEALDVVWRAQGLTHRTQFLRRALGSYLRHLGAIDAAALLTEHE